MAISQGDTLLPDHSGSHLWVVLTNPRADSPDVVLVNLTSLRPDVDTTVILNRGDHPFVRHQTVINYADSRFGSIKSINEGCDRGIIKILDPVSGQLLQRIKQGLLESREHRKTSRNTAVRVGANRASPWNPDRCRR